MDVFLNGRYLPQAEALISPDDRGFLFADGVYEVVRIYGGRLFAAQDHWDRLARSLRELRLRGAESYDFGGISNSLIERNRLGSADAIVYLQITRGVAPRKHAFPSADVPLTVYGFARAYEVPVQQMQQGVKAILALDIRWARCDIKTVSLLPNVLANQQAHEADADEAVLVRDGAVTEGSHSNFAAIIDGVFVTAPLSNYILGGITRGIVLKLCRQLNIPVREFPILERELASADEMMLLGTTTEVLPVVQLGDQRVGEGRPGPVTLKLQRAFRELASQSQPTVAAG